jgi:N-formylglutamate deformylase
MVIPGDPDSSVLLHVPHAGTQVPEWTRPHLLLDDAVLAAEIAALTDHRTDELALAAAEKAKVRPWVIVNPVSRFVVDVERFPDEREEMAAVGMGAVYTHGTRGQPIRAVDSVEG